MLTAAVLWLLSFYVLYLAVRYGVQHGIEAARQSAEAQESERQVEQ